ncbi:MAG: hypothetical protein ABFS42_05015 [Candidatus Krumholzibacteriota bacterium]
MYIKLDTETKVPEKEKTETIRQDDCQCVCNSATEVPEEPDGVIVARNFSTNQIQVDTVPD